VPDIFWACPAYIVHIKRQTISNLLAKTKAPPMANIFSCNHQDVHLNISEYITACATAL